MIRDSDAYHESDFFMLDHNSEVADEVWQEELHRRRRVSQARKRRPALRSRPSKSSRPLQKTRLRMANRSGNRRTKLVVDRPSKQVPFHHKYPRPIWPLVLPGRFPPEVTVNIQPPESVNNYPADRTMNGGNGAMPAPSTEPVEQGSEFIRWVQSTLNYVMKLNLPVDGIMGSETRSAIRSFQERNGLFVDGIIGPDTKAALSATRRGGLKSSPAKGEVDSLEGEYFLDAFWGRSRKPKGLVNRMSPLYIRWVQRSLNKIIGQGLPVDGIHGTKTRNAIRAFQRRTRLTADGVVGAKTEAALIAAGATQPPNVPKPGSRTSLSSSHSAISMQALRNNIVKMALQEWERWQRGRIKEDNPQIRSILEGYWRKGAGWLPKETRWWSTVPWSAAFISWVMRHAGAGQDFRYSGAHAVYIAAARDNRLANNSNPFKAYRISEAAPQLGDLVCRRRQSGVTYDNVRRGHLTHCDVVTAVKAGRVLTIGGNVSNSVSITPVAIDGNGRITDPRYFAIIKIG
ncbi:MAG: DUF2272 domain-containing protein [Anaerolineaceae bacterium]|nr:DUF2272 domain-containing protein [Anaerolineaceae bacterium]